jgi:hypothetical protein
MDKLSTPPLRSRHAHRRAPRRGAERRLSPKDWRIDEDRERKQRGMIRGRRPTESSAPGADRPTEGRADPRPDGLSGIQAWGPGERPTSRPSTADRRPTEPIPGLSGARRPTEYGSSSGMSVDQGLVGRPVFLLPGQPAPPADSVGRCRDISHLDRSAGRQQRARLVARSSSRWWSVGRRQRGQRSVARRPRRPSPGNGWSPGRSVAKRSVGRQRRGQRSVACRPVAGRLRWGRSVTVVVNTQPSVWIGRPSMPAARVARRPTQSRCSAAK